MSDEETNLRNQSERRRDYEWLARSLFNEPAKVRFRRTSEFRGKISRGRGGYLIELAEGMPLEVEHGCFSHECAHALSGHVRVVSRKEKAVAKFIEAFLLSPAYASVMEVDVKAVFDEVSARLEHEADIGGELLMRVWFPGGTYRTR